MSALARMAGGIGAGGVGGPAARARAPAAAAAARGRGRTGGAGRRVRARARAPAAPEGGAVGADGALRPGETADEARERRERESAEMEARVIEVATLEDFDAHLEAAGDSTLVVVDFDSQEVCEAGGNDPLPEEFWKPTKEEKMRPCGELRHTLQRCARQCPDATFLSVDTTSEGGSEIAFVLGVDIKPTLHFYRKGRLLWEHAGYKKSQTGLGEGVLYFGEGQADSVVKQLHCDGDVEAFVSSGLPGQLMVVDVALESDAKCIHMYPALVSLAKAMREKGQGQAAFGRLIGDRDDQHLAAMAKLGVDAVPAFLFFRDGNRIGSYLGSTRADLLGKVLEMQGADGIHGSRMRR